MKRTTEINPQWLAFSIMDTWKHPLLITDYSQSHGEGFIFSSSALEAAAVKFQVGDSNMVKDNAVPSVPGYIIGLSLVLWKSNFSLGQVTELKGRYNGAGSFPM